MEFYATKVNGKLEMPAIQRHFREKFIESIPDGKEVVETVKIVRKSKTKNQLGAHWGLAMRQATTELEDRGYDTSFLLNIDKPTGIGIDEKLLCEYMYNVCPLFNDSGKRITLSHKDCDTKIASKFFNDCRDFMASQWAIVIADPDPNWNKELRK